MIVLDIVERDELDHGNSARTSLFLLFYASVGTAVAVALLLCLARPRRPQTHAASIPVLERLGLSTTIFTRGTVRAVLPPPRNAVGGPRARAAPIPPALPKDSKRYLSGHLIKPAVRMLAQNGCVPQSALERPESMGPARRSVWIAGCTGAHAVSAPPQVSRARPAAPTAPTQRQQLLQLLTPASALPTPASAPPLPPCQHEDTHASANLQYGLALTCALQRTSKREDHRAQRPLRAPLQRRPPVTQRSARACPLSAEHFAHGDKIPGLKASGIDIIAAQQAIKFARKWAVDDKSGPLLDFVACRYGDNSCVTRNLTLAGREIEGGRTSLTATKRASGIWFRAAIARASPSVTCMVVCRSSSRPGPSRWRPSSGSIDKSLDMSNGVKAKIQDQEGFPPGPAASDLWSTERVYCTMQPVLVDVPNTHLQRPFKESNLHPTYAFCSSRLPDEFAGLKSQLQLDCSDFGNARERPKKSTDGCASGVIEQQNQSGPDRTAAVKLITPNDHPRRAAPDDSPRSPPPIVPGALMAAFGTPK
ncbi:hypothetical protein FB451DRAFT_1177093 [Mycena latifolia]|nr:hypothetical protein FB451DRAFT_1177093 [Mycena latifolia]